MKKQLFILLLLLTTKTYYAMHVGYYNEYDTPQIILAKYIQYSSDIVTHRSKFQAGICGLTCMRKYQHRLLQELGILYTLATITSNAKEFARWKPFVHNALSKSYHTEIKDGNAKNQVLILQAYIAYTMGRYDEKNQKSHYALAHYFLSQMLPEEAIEMLDEIDRKTRNDNKAYLLAQLASAGFCK